MDLCLSALDYPVDRREGDTLNALSRRRLERGISRAAKVEEE